jgi:hypothetical protein
MWGAQYAELGREFAIEGAGPRFITARQIGEDHRYTFNVIKSLNGKRLLSLHVILKEEHRAIHPGRDCETGARAFAEREARKAGLID